MTTGKNDTCQACLDLLDDYRKKQLSDEETKMMERHLAECPACAEELEEQIAIGQLLCDHVNILKTNEPLVQPSVSENLASNIQDIPAANNNTDSGGKLQHQGPARWFPFTLGVAALILISFLGFAWLKTISNPINGRPTIALNSAKPRPALAAEMKPFESKSEDYSMVIPPQSPTESQTDQPPLESKKSKPASAPAIPSPSGRFQNKNEIQGAIRSPAFDPQMEAFQGAIPAMAEARQKSALADKMTPTDLHEGANVNVAPAEIKAQTMRAKQRMLAMESDEAKDIGIASRKAEGVAQASQNGTRELTSAKAGSNDRIEGFNPSLRLEKQSIPTVAESAAPPSATAAVLKSVMTLSSSTSLQQTSSPLSLADAAFDQRNWQLARTRYLDILASPTLAGKLSTQSLSRIRTRLDQISQNAVAPSETTVP